MARRARPRPHALCTILPIALPLLIATILSLAATAPGASAQRLSTFLTPSDLATLRGDAAAGGPFAASGARPRLLPLDAPDVDCIDEDATPTSVTLRVRAGASGAPFGFMVEWMDVISFALNNGWYRADDPRLCRLRLTVRVPPGGWVNITVGGDVMLAELEEANKRLHEHEHDHDHENDNHNKDDAGEKKKKKDDEPPPPPRPLPLPDSDVFGEEACLGPLAPDTAYVFRARARGDRAAARRDEGGHDSNKGDEDDPDRKNRKDDGERGTTDPSLWSRNVVCATDPEEAPPLREERGGEEAVRGGGESVDMEDAAEADAAVATLP